MKILLAVPKYNLSQKPDFNYIFPSGLAYISATLKKEGHEVDCFNLNHYSGSVEDLIKRALDKKKYDIFCSGGNSLAYRVFEKMINVAKKHPTKPLFILGGPILTSEPELMLNALGPDIGVLGEGEETIVELLKFIEEKKDLKKVKGIIFKERNGEIINNQPRMPTQDINSIPFPDLEGLRFEKYVDNMHCNDHWAYHIFDYPRAYHLLASRGCPFNCSFCWNPEKYRARSIDNIMEEIKEVVIKYRINYLIILDDCFSANKERLLEFCKRIKELSREVNHPIGWCCQLLVKTVDKDVLRILKDAGCNNISYGFESFSPIVLKSMRKPITPQQIDSTLRETLKMGIGIQGNFIFGDIAETKETAKETLDYWKTDFQTRQISLGFVQPFPGSDIYKYCIKKGIIKDRLDYMINHMSPDNRINMTEKMTDEEIRNLATELLEAFRKYARFVTPLSIKCIDKTKKSYTLKIKCPYCKNIITYGNCFIENKYTYGFHLICRNCFYRSVIVGPVKKLAYKYYPWTRKIRDNMVSIRKRVKGLNV